LRWGKIKPQILRYAIANSGIGIHDRMSNQHQVTPHQPIYDIGTIDEKHSLMVDD